MLLVVVGKLVTLCYHLGIVGIGVCGIVGMSVIR